MANQMGEVVVIMGVVIIGFEAKNAAVEAFSDSATTIVEEATRKLDTALAKAGFVIIRATPYLYLAEKRGGRWFQDFYSSRHERAN